MVPKVGCSNVLNSAHIQFWDLLITITILMRPQRELTVSLCHNKKNNKLKVTAYWYNMAG